MDGSSRSASFPAESTVVLEIVQCFVNSARTFAVEDGKPGLGKCDLRARCVSGFKWSSPCSEPRKFLRMDR